MTPGQFHKLCGEHDWTYEFSDDHRSWARGVAQREQLLTAMRQHPELEKIYRAWVAYTNSRVSIPKPVAPVE